MNKRLREPIIEKIHFSMPRYKYLHKKTQTRQPKRIVIDKRKFIQLKSILFDNAAIRCQHWKLNEIDHFQALSLIDWCKVSEKKRGEIRQELREKGIDEALADKIKDRKKIEEPKAYQEICKRLRQEKLDLEGEKQQLTIEIRQYEALLREHSAISK